MKDLFSFLNEVSSNSDFKAALSERGGFITFSNSGRRGSSKFFQIGLDNILQTLKDILINIETFKNLTEYDETSWRNNGAEYFSDPVANANSTVQTKPLFSTLSKVINWANQPMLDFIDSDAKICLDKEVLETAIAKLEIVADSFRPSVTTNTNDNTCHQVIYYGAPGTGKSHRIKAQLQGVSKENIFRTTFHPDSDYSTFVGAYKPTRGKRPLYGLFGKETVRMKDGDELFDDIITYKFVPQAFLNAYIRAYQTDENVYLIIEEINRGNCAQIFGDLFQLLDRDANGNSEYGIKADADLKSYLAEVLGKDNPSIKDGELCLPSNLYIYATMNTSDQSLFPIDSAFKRRWDWEYEPIKYKNTGWKIIIDDTEYSWVSFQRIVNERIFDATNSEDKMLGDYFVNPSDGVITDKVLLNKILFYLWNDVCKDGEGDIFKISETEEISFSELYGTDKSDKLKAMMNYLQVEVAEEAGEKDVEQEILVDSANKIEINGKIVKYINAIPYMAIKEYVSLHPEKTSQEILDIWSPFKKYSMRSWVVCNKQERDSMNPGYANYALEINCSDGQSIWVNKDGWMHNPTKQRDTIAEFIDAVNKSGLGIRITETFI